MEIPSGDVPMTRKDTGRKTETGLCDLSHSPHCVMGQLLVSLEEYEAVL